MVREQELAKRLHEAQAQVLEEQEKLLKEQERITLLEDKAISTWKVNELPALLRIEREAAVQAFKEKEPVQISAQQAAPKEVVVERVVEKVVEVPNQKLLEQ